LFAATAVQAQVLFDPAPGSGAKVYASELKLTAPLLVGGVNVTTTAILGFGLSTAQDRYIRYDLVGGATFAVAVLPGDLVVTTSTPAVVQGGQIGDAYVVFQITSTSNVPATGTSVFTPQAASISIPTATTQTIRYTLHETAVSAQGTVSGGLNVNNGRLIDKTANLLTFSKVLGFTMGGSNPETAAATTGFAKLCAPTPNTGLPGTAGCAASSTDQIAIAGTIATYQLLNLTTLDATSTPITALNTVIASATVTATTDAGTFQTAGTAGFTALTPNCLALGTGGALNAGKTIATYTLPVTAGQFGFGASGQTSLCYGVDGVTALIAQKFTGSFNPVYTAGYTGAATVSAGQIGEIVRDGSELQSPWFTLGGPGSAYISRFFLTNTAAAAVTCTVKLLTETGNVLTPVATSVTIPANGQLAVLGTDIAASAGVTTVANRGAAIFLCPAPSTTIQGRYVVTHSSGAVDSGTLLRPGTN